MSAPFYCLRCRKDAFDGEDDALAELEHIAQRRVRSVIYQETRAYPCPHDIHLWHLTHRPERNTK